MMEPRQSKITQIATLLETYLPVSVRVGLRGALFVGTGFLLYIGIGITAGILGWFDPPYPFLSFKTDPFFVVGGTVVGLFIVQSAGSLVLYHFLVGIKDDKSQLTVLLAFISLGFGGALLRVTLPTAIQLLFTLLVKL